MRANVFRRTTTLELLAGEAAAIQGISAIQDVYRDELKSIEEETLMQGVASTDEVTVVPIVPSGTTLKWCLYDVQTADVNFEFTIKGRTVIVPAHKCLLAHQSSVFLQMFFGDLTSEDHVINKVKMTDTTPEEFVEFARCFYYESTTITAINARALVYLTHKYNVKIFENRCRFFLHEMISSNKVSIFWVLPLTILLNYETLRQSCVNLIHSHGRILMECLKFANCSLDTLMSILKVNFVGRDEARVFEKCISWAAESCEHKKFDPTSRENIRSQLGDCFVLIHFDRMSPSQFVQCIGKHSYIFHPDEIGSIAETVKGQEQDFDTVVVPQLISIRSINDHFIRFAKIMQNDANTADVFFIFGNPPGNEQKRIAAHKCILCMFSPILKSELMALGKSNEVYITDASFEAYSAFIQLTYGCRKLFKYNTHLSNENIDKIVMLVKKYNVRCGILLDRFEDELMSIQDDDNLFWLFELSRIHSLQFLYFLCISQIGSGRGSGIFSSDAFLNLCPESFKTVFSIVLNKCDAETVCEAGLKWAKEFCTRNHLAKSGENVRMALGDFWPMMPFVDLEPTEFIRHRRDLGDIFSSEQIKTIIDTMANEYGRDSFTSMDEQQINVSDDDHLYSLPDVSGSIMERSVNDSEAVDDTTAE